MGRYRVAMLAAGFIMVAAFGLMVLAANSHKAETTEAERIAFVGRTMALYNMGAVTRSEAARIMAEHGCKVKDLDTWAALPEVAGRPVRAEVDPYYPTGPADPKDVPAGGGGVHD